jgi:Tfp pilus assembly protein PilV
MRKNLSTTALLILAAMGTNAYAETMNCDSACLGRMAATIPSQIQGIQKEQTVYGSMTLQMAPTTSTQTVKYTYAQCPSGFTYQGSSLYPTSQQVIITYYTNGQITGTQTMPPQDLSNDCTATQYQTLQCPVGQTGSITQSRQVATDNGGYSYGPWITTSNSCVASGGTWKWLGWQYGRGNPSPYAQCNLYTTGIGKSCSPSGTRCSFPDDMTSRIGTFLCQ